MITRREYIRVMRRVDVTETCWLWTGYRMKDRYGNKVYGLAKLRGKPTYVHKIIYLGLVGDIPKGLELDHTCRNVACVNSEHLEPVTHAENVKRGKAGLFHTVKQFCPQGHEYTEDNIYYDKHKNGNRHRKCRTCVKARVLEAYYDTK